MAGALVFDFEDPSTAPNCFPSVKLSSTRYARRFARPFITIDVARRADGRWMIVETGDAGVSGLPAVIAPADFYAALRRKSSGE